MAEVSYQRVRPEITVNCYRDVFGRRGRRNVCVEQKREENEPWKDPRTVRKTLLKPEAHTERLDVILINPKVAGSSPTHQPVVTWWSESVAEGL